MSTPVTITHHGRARLVLMSMEEYERLAHAQAAAKPAGAWEGGALLHAVTNQMRDGFIAFSESLKITDANVAAELHLGVDRARLFGQDLRDVIAGSRASILWDHLSWVLRTRQPSEHQLKSVAQEGRRMNFRLFPYGEGGVAMIFNSLSAAEEAGRLTRRFQALEALLRAGPATSLIQLNARGEIEATDAAFAQLTGFAEQHLPGVLLAEIIEPTARAAFSRALSRTVKTGDPNWVSTVMVSRSGELKRISLCLCAAGDETSPGEVFVAVTAPGEMTEAPQDL